MNGLKAKFSDDPQVNPSLTWVWLVSVLSDSKSIKDSKIKVYEVLVKNLAVMGEMKRDLMAYFELSRTSTTEFSFRK